MKSSSYSRGNDRWSTRGAFRRTACAALIAVQLAGCTSWRAQPVVPSDLSGVVAAHPSSPFRFTLGNGSEVVVSHARVDGDTVIGIALGSQVRVAVGDIRMVARRRTNPWLTAGLVYVVAGSAFLVACGGSDCLAPSFGQWR